MVFMNETNPNLRLVVSRENLDSSEGVEPSLDDNAFDLLSEDDMTEIARYGVPCGLRSDLVEVSAAGLRFTMKGRQYYRRSLELHCVDQALEAICDQDELIELHANIFASVRREVRGVLHAEYRAGRIPAQERELVEARLFGAAGEVLRALKRSVRFAQTGKNIIPLSFKEKRRS